MSDRAKPWLVDGPALDPKLLAVMDHGRDALAVAHASPEPRRPQTLGEGRAFARR